MPPGMDFAWLPVTTVLFHGKRMVKMDPVATIAFAFLIGLTAGGLAGSVLELASGRRLGFVEPFMSRSHVVRSLGAAALAGPFMLCNDALAAYRERRISAAALVSCAGTAFFWCLALGVALGALAHAVLSSPG